MEIWLCPKTFDQSNVEVAYILRMLLATSVCGYPYVQSRQIELISREFLGCHDLTIQLCLMPTINMEHNLLSKQ